MTSGCCTPTYSSGFCSSGSVSFNHDPYPAVKKNCDNCGSNQIIDSECQHCGTWYGHGSKHKPKINTPNVPESYWDTMEPKTKRTFWQKLFGL